MSAFMVSHRHIDALVDYAQAWDGLSWYDRSNEEEYGPVYVRLRTGDIEGMERIGNVLLAENRASVNYRYSEDELEPSDCYTHHWHGGLSAVGCLKALSCLEYQSCEHPDWPTSEAHAFVVALRGKAIANLPGYSEARWEVDA